MRILSSIFLLACFAFYSQSEAINRQIPVSQQSDYVGIASGDKKFQKATQLIREGKYQKAQDVINQLIQDFPQEAPLYNNLAMIYLRHNKLDEGKALLTQGLKTSPNYYVIYENLQKIKQYEARLSYNSVLGEKSDTSKMNYRFLLIDKLRLPQGWEETSQINVASNGNILETALFEKSQNNPEPEVSRFATRERENNLANKRLRNNKPLDRKKGISQKDVESIAREVRPASYKKLESNKTKPKNASVGIASLQQKNKKIKSYKPTKNRKTIQKEFESWLDAWSSGDFQDYMSFYSKEFRAKNMRYNAWKKYRSQRVSPNKNISVKYTNLKIAPLGKSKMKLTYNQSYKSKTYASNTKKTMTWVLDGKDWKILSERAL